ncbi:MAG: hypothetical protein JNL09_09980 [Anaerolineales bacterium]|nr:hypothetical protein [Anaerolineales bacterium]
MAIANFPSISEDWEYRWAPYDAGTYALALNFLRPTDVVLDIGAGDLRFARLAARHVLRVIALERNASLLPPSPSGRGAGGEGELVVVCADALTWPFPRGVTVGVLLMRHCRHFREYAAKLRACGCQRLITNARWGMSVEEVDLPAPRQPYAQIYSQWYACECGAVGFAPGPLELIDSDSLERVIEVRDCPHCDNQ